MEYERLYTMQSPCKLHANLIQTLLKCNEVNYELTAVSPATVNQKQ
jgi:hypothetical protein